MPFKKIFPFIYFLENFFFAIIIDTQEVAKTFHLVFPHRYILHNHSSNSKQIDIGNIHRPYFRFRFHQFYMYSFMYVCVFLCTGLCKCVVLCNHHSNPDTKVVHSHKDFCPATLLWLYLLPSLDNPYLHLYIFIFSRCYVDRIMNGLLRLSPHLQ